MNNLIQYLDQGWQFEITKEYRSSRSIKTNINRFELKINEMISKNDYSKFEYIYDTIDKCLLMGVYASLNRMNKDRYVKYGSNKNFQTYKDTLTGKIHQIDPLEYPILENFKPYNAISKILKT